MDMDAARIFLKNAGVAIATLPTVPYQKPQPQTNAQVVVMKNEINNLLSKPTVNESDAAALINKYIYYNDEGGGVVPPELIPFYQSFQNLRYGSGAVVYNLGEIPSDKIKSIMASIPVPKTSIVKEPTTNADVSAPSIEATTAISKIAPPPEVLEKLNPSQQKQLTAIYTTPMMTTGDNPADYQKAVPFNLYPDIKFSQFRTEANPYRWTLPQTESRDMLTFFSDKPVPGSQTAEWIRAVNEGRITDISWGMNRQELAHLFPDKINFHLTRLTGCDLVSKNLEMIEHSIFNQLVHVSGFKAHQCVS